MPQLNLPVLYVGMPSAIPEIPLIKKTNQVAAAKIAVYAFNRITGEPVWQSGIAQYGSNAKNYWLFGAGPFEAVDDRPALDSDAPAILHDAQIGDDAADGEGEFDGDLVAVLPGSRERHVSFLVHGGGRVAAVHRYDRAFVQPIGIRIQIARRRLIASPPRDPHLERGRRIGRGPDADRRSAAPGHLAADRQRHHLPSHR